MEAGEGHASEVAVALAEMGVNEDERKESDEAMAQLLAAQYDEECARKLEAEDERVRQEEKDAALAVQLQNGRSIEEIERMQMQFGLDPTEVLTQRDVAEIRQRNIVKKLLAVKARNPVNGKLHLVSHFDYYGSNVHGHGWDCGYKNLQMMFSCLLEDKAFAYHLKRQGISEVPSVPELQGRIEGAWSQGFDQEGKEELGGALLDETKWIGPMEAAALLRSLRIRGNIMDFSSNSEDSLASRLRLIEWVSEYFSSRCTGKKGLFTSSAKCPKCSGMQRKKPACLIPPIFLQHQGHSRTIVGVAVAEEPKDSQLLIMDPNMRFGRDLRTIMWEKIQFGIDSPALQESSFQIIYIDPKHFYKTDAEWEQSKSFLG